MEPNDRLAAWWQLYLLGLVMIGLLVVGARAPLSEFGHQVAAIGTLLLVYGLVELWLRANRAALLRVSKLILVQGPRPKVIRETPDEESVPVYVSWRLALETEIVAGGNGDHDTDQATEEVSAPVERESS
jgi:hypothetical protein